MENYEETSPEEFAPVQKESPEVPVLVITEDIRSYVYETAKWAKFLAIVGFVFCALIIIAAFSVGAIMGTLSTMTPGMGAFGKMGAGFLTVIYLIFGLLYFYPSLMLFKYANAAKRAILFSDQLSLSEAMGKMKSFFKFYGILMIIVISIYALIFLFAIVAGIGAATMAN
ncbi:DUF5362 family protein [Pedobacter metabolipauper]|uniref:DUF5362 domain-containing protein n=1 Tax=Pedobacter metabolipauper TaxID=425513 RepID=A0A4R6SRW2_9SPHI|nr:DUF5362 family protein [Pedobacter metabolipauper]TDQ06964.1 hypothetical protein ATK78_3980 [Pedobacter metabolipauper]